MRIYNIHGAFKAASLHIAVAPVKDLSFKSKERIKIERTSAISFIHSTETQRPEVSCMSATYLERTLAWGHVHHHSQIMILLNDFNKGYELNSHWLSEMKGLSAAGP